MKQNIPFFSLKRQWINFKSNFLPDLDRLLETNQYIGGPYIAEFEKQFAQHTGSSHSISCNSGTDALWLALKALEVKPSSIVLTTPFSFIASSSEIVAHRAQPVFIDVDESYNICPKEIEKWLKSNAITQNNKAIHKQTGQQISGILTVDLFGQCADYSKITALAKEWGLWIIEDACQAVGSHVENKKAGTFGDIACFSLYPTKNLGVCGDGGVLTTSNPQLADKLLQLRNHGRKKHYDYECYGRNSRLDTIQALVATKKLSFIDDYNARRREIAQIYTKRFSHIPFIKTPVEKRGYHVYHQYCIQVSCRDLLNRDLLKDHLTENQVGTNIFYPKSLADIPFLSPPKEFYNPCPRTKELTQTILALPIWPELTNKEINYVCDLVESFAPLQRSAGQALRKPNTSSY